ncbi:Modifier of mdg4 [Operophtera brumata]|uniref:Modifier of mdg4 n=1 Tax=Operophtera brumata TaxID=104452 RepID=A0A0L7KW02_OPEBR|nr:Modifier of mdg4 [Operophtera brumata]
MFIADHFLIPTGKGKYLLIWRGYTYSEITGKYYCSARQTKVKCKARLKLDAGGNIASAEGEHDHAPPKYIYTAGQWNVCENHVMIPTRRGKYLLMWRGYTYSEITGKYYCSAKQTLVKCKARLKLDAEGNIVSADGEHEHEPPKYVRRPNGAYVKVKGRYYPDRY